MKALSIVSIAAAAAAIAAPALAASPCGCPPRHAVVHRHPVHYLARRAPVRTRTVVRTVVVTRYVHVPVRYAEPPPPPPRYEGPPPPPPPVYYREPARFEHVRPPCRHGEFRYSEHRHGDDRRGDIHRGDWRDHDSPRHDWSRVVYRY